MTLDNKVKIISDEHGKKVVQMDLDVFQAIESYIEDQGLLELIIESEKDESLCLEDALDYYSKLPKSP